MKETFKVESKLPKTKRYIRTAFIQLLQEKSVQEITVKDITEKSELGRTTFYLHYRDKYQLLNEIEEDLISGFFILMRKFAEKGDDYFLRGVAKGYLPEFTQYFSYMRANGDAFKTLFQQNSGTDFLDRFTKAMMEYRTNSGLIWNKGTSKLKKWSSQYGIQFLVNDYVNVFYIWVTLNMEIPDEEMGRFLTAKWKGYILSLEPSTPEILYERLKKALSS